MQKPNNSLFKNILWIALFSGPLMSCTLSSGGAQSPPPRPTNKSTQTASGLIRSNYQEKEVEALCQAAINKTDASLVALTQLPQGTKNIASTLLTFEKVLADFNDETIPLTFMGYVSTNPVVSAEGSDCEQKVGQFYVDIFTRRALYDLLKIQQSSDAAEIRLLTQTLLNFEQNGLMLSDEILSQVKDLKSQLAAKESQFSTNLNADTSTVLFSAEELQGAHADFLGRLTKTSDGQYIVTTKSTDYLDVMQNAVNSETRHKMMLAYLNRGGTANTELLQQAVALRLQIAKTLGFKSWADYRTKPRMAKTSESVLQFLNNLKSKLAVRNQQDQAQLLNFKKQLDPAATTLNQWDNAYLSYQLQKRDFDLDEEKIREYFPAATVVSGIFDVYSKLLGVTYNEVKDAQVWADGVKLYEIHDQKDSRLIGYFYTDLIPRAGKYGHAAAFPLIAGREIDGKYSLPVSSIVANFTPPSEGKPSLLTHDEVETFFHEFGHIMHQTLTTAKYASLSGSSVAQDFVEAPSQMLENWVWNKSILGTISGHYLNSSEKLPDSLLTKMLAARNFQQGSSYTKQLLYALYDMTLHGADSSLDVTETYNTLYRQIMGQEPLPENHFPASFGHLMGGYDAGYYGYLWSEVYAQDMFSQFPATDLTNQTVGLKYRKMILEPGNMVDAIDLLKNFLGREPNSDAFFKKLGL